MISLATNAVKVLEQRYLLRDASGKLIETPEQLFSRVAKAVAAAELTWGAAADASRWEEKFFYAMSELLFLPNSPTLMNAGITNGQLSACFVLPVQDNMNSIFTALKNAALIQQSGGGTGFNFSQLRPAGDAVNGNNGIASGPVSFMKIFDTATEHIKQGGKRRGANMGILDIDHPDIEAFISCKKENGVLSNFNISVGITNDFMHALENNRDWKLVHPNSGALVKKINAAKVWNAIVENAWMGGDPGLIFTDHINEYNPTPALGNMDATNPCGEVPLLPYEPCNLGSINLSRFVKKNNDTNAVDWQLLENVINIAVRFLDNVIAVNHYMLPEIKAMALGNRKIGLGVMGWAEMLIQLAIPYDSEHAVQLAENLMHFIRQKSDACSGTLAAERGVFKNWEKSIYYPAVSIRNATRTSIAPTGTISIIADTSPSIEPLFALAFRRKHVLGEETLFSINHSFISYLHTHQLFSQQLVEQVMNEGNLSNVNELPPSVKNIFKTSPEIAPYWHLRHQLAFQRHTCNAVSKTINLPETASIRDVDEIYRYAWHHQAKGITIFRDRSRNRQVIYQGITLQAKACSTCIE